MYDDLVDRTTQYPPRDILEKLEQLEAREEVAKRTSQTPVEMCEWRCQVGEWDDRPCVNH